MNKSAIKNFAMRARNNLMAAVEQKAFEIGVTRSGIKDIETFQGGFRVNDRVFKASEVEQRKKLIQKIREKGFDQVIEEVAYTWFNRFIALRFMEVNEYLPTGVRILSSTDTNKTEPDIIREALNIELDIDKNVVYQYQDKNDTEGLFKYLLIKQCNELAKIMPVMFEEIEDYTELLLPDHLLTEGSVIRDLVESIEEEDFKEQVEIIGWLYQYYISEKKDEVFEGLKKNVKITKENIPAATQLFTPDWIVKYMVENSLGKLWLDSHPNEELKMEWKYYIEEAEQEPDVQKQLNEIRKKDINPEEIKILDPAMGSGHILVYAFDVFYEIYKSAGYSEKDIPKLILEKNLYGLDIDDRAGQLAYFALMMKARSKNRRIFREKIEMNLCAIQESSGFPKEAIDLLVSRKDTNLEKQIRRQEVEYLIEVFHDAKEYGSILDVKKIDFESVEKRVEEIKKGHFEDLLEYQYRNIIIDKIPMLIKQAKVMSQRYEVICTNPPYLGRKGMNQKLTRYVDDNYAQTKNDLFSVFIEYGFKKLVNDGYNSMVTMHSWMFLDSYEDFRKEVISKYAINSILHLGYEAFDSIIGKVVQTVAFVIRKSAVDMKPQSIRLVDFYDSNRYLKESEFFNLGNRYNKLRQYDFFSIPGYTFAYWISKELIECFKRGHSLESKSYVITKGIFTGDNERFIRYWFEVSNDKIPSKWHKYSKGGPYRKWYGNSIFVINWENDAYELRNFEGSGIGASKYYGLPHIVWSKVTTLDITFRKDPDDVYFDDASPAILFNVFNTNILGFINTKVCREIVKIIAPTLNYQIGDIKRIPIIEPEVGQKEYIDSLTNKCVSISKDDWDSYEISWDFKKHPFIYDLCRTNSIKDTFDNWNKYLNEQCSSIKNTEEELNEIFIKIYGLKDFSSEIDEKEITINKADRNRDIRSFISYAVGCIFGRYSLDEDGLVYAGGNLDINRYRTIKPTEDNILPIADDVYFEEDIVSRFIDFVKDTFGKERLEENLDYIAETLNKKPSETSRQAIRRYFLNDFYKDHVQVYKKRPIYWLFDSGKQGGFKALIYMHRYDPYTVARVRTDYLHKLQKKYDAEINRLDIVLESNISQAEKTKARKKKEDLIKKMQECTVYDQAIAHVANQKIEIDLDDGVAVNYAKFQGVEIPQGEGKKPLKADLLAKI